MGERRPARVAHLVQAEVAGWLVREAQDPRLRAVTVTAVRMTPDLRIAHVYFRTLAGADAGPEAQRALERVAPVLRGEVGRALGLRVTPELRFAYDTVPDAAQRVDDLLRSASATRERDEDDP